MSKQDEFVEVRYVVPKSLQKEIADKIAAEVKSGYYWDLTKAVSEKVQKAIESDGFADRVSDAVIEKIKMSESDYIDGVTEQIKDALMQTTGVIAQEVLKKVQEKVQSYGFIKVGDRY